jgi:capsule polysaccharide export protein KpsE/RkpR
VFEDNIIEFKPKYPFTLPSDWKDEDNPTIYEINATLETIKKMYYDQVKEIKDGNISKELGEKKLRNIATNYQSIKAILFQYR